MKAFIDFPQPGRTRIHLRFSAPVASWAAEVPDEVEAAIALAERHAREECWVVGFVGYEAAPAFDPAFATRPPSGNLPLAAFAAYDRPQEIAGGTERGFDCGPWRMETDRARFDETLAAIHGAIDEGRYYQVNYTTRLLAAFSGNARALFEELRLSQPEGYCAFLDGGAWQILSASPELFFEWTPEDRRLTTQPMKGTAPRHADLAADDAAARALAGSEKERAENLMIVDLLRNDLARIAETGTVDVPSLFDVSPLPTAWQMTSTVDCTVRRNLGLVNIFRALFPSGSVTGAPKVAAMQEIARIEESPRGIYCGALGLIRPGGAASFSVAIRTVALDRAQGTAECGIGSGITADASAEGEYAEWLVKRRFLLRASAGFDLIETLRLGDGDFWLLPRHLERLEASAEHFGFPLNEDSIVAALEATAAEHPVGIWRVRLLLDRHGAPKTECTALPATPEEVAVALAASPIDADDEFLRHKTTQRQVYAPHAAPPGAFDTLLWNARGEITEFTIGNVVVEIDGRRLTPPVSCGLLPGVMRAELLARGEIEEGVVAVDDLTRATGLWFINSVRGRVPARLVRG